MDTIASFIPTLSMTTPSLARSRAAHRMSAAFPTQGQLTLGLLDVLAEQPRGPKAVADALARRFDIAPEAREARVPIEGGRRTVNALDRHVRFALLKARALKLVDSPSRNLWQITEAGAKGLRSAARSVVITVITGARGVGLWAYAEDAAAILDDASVALLLTSPPYPLMGQPKSYGNLPDRAHVDWLVRVIEAYLPKLDALGSIVLNVGDVDRVAVLLVLQFLRPLAVSLGGAGQRPVAETWVAYARAACDILIKEGVNSPFTIKTAPHTADLPVRTPERRAARSLRPTTPPFSRRGRRAASGRGFPERGAWDVHDRGCLFGMGASLRRVRPTTSRDPAARRSRLSLRPDLRCAQQTCGRLLEAGISDVGGCYAGV